MEKDQPTLDTRYRIYVGESTIADIEPIVSGYVRAATFYDGVGVWESVRESCVIVEVIGSATQRAGIETLARQLRDSFNQDCVLLTVEAVRGELI